MGRQRTIQTRLRQSSEKTESPYCAARGKDPDLANIQFDIDTLCLSQACLEYNNLFAASYILQGLQNESTSKLNACWPQCIAKILNCAKTLNNKIKQLQTTDNDATVYIPHLGKQLNKN